MRKVIIALLLLSVCAFGSMSDVYIAQTAQGGGTGANCANAVAKTFFNTSGNWGSGGSQIGAGTTVHLCGTISVASTATAVLIFNGSGSAGSPITMRWEGGAVVESPACGIDGDSCIVASNLSYIVMDGNGTSPSVQNTANGSALTNHINSFLVNMQGCDNCEFKNITLANSYVMSSLTDPNGDRQYGLSFQGSNVLIHDSTIHDAFACMDDEYQDGDTNISVYNMAAYNCNWGLHIGNNAPTSLSDVFVHDNHFYNFANWDNNSDAYHHDGVFIVQNDFSASITNAQIYNNVFDGTMSNCASGAPGSTCMTAYVFTNTGFKSLYVYNNIFTGDNGSSYLAEGGISGDLNYNFFNNVFDCAGGFCLNFSSVSGFTFENDVFMNVGSNPNNFSGLTDVTFDYNAYQSRAGVTPFFSEPHSVDTASLGLNDSYRPQSGAAVIGAGLNLTGLGIAALDFDAAEVARPSSGAWDIGAYQYQAPPAPGAGAVCAGPCGIFR